MIIASYIVIGYRGDPLSCDRNKSVGCFLIYTEIFGSLGSAFPDLVSIAYSKNKHNGCIMKRFSGHAWQNRSQQLIFPINYSKKQKNSTRMETRRMNLQIKEKTSSEHKANTDWVTKATEFEVENNRMCISQVYWARPLTPSKYSINKVSFTINFG